MSGRAEASKQLRRLRLAERLLDELGEAWVQLESRDPDGPNSDQQGQSGANKEWIMKLLD
jgi:hypothetical protein